MSLTGQTFDIKKAARAAGVLYLLIFIFVPLSFIIGRGGIDTSGNAEATIASIAAGESLFRIGMAGESVVFLVEIVLAALLYVLLKPVNPALSLGAAFARVGEAIIQAVNLLVSFMVLLIIGEAGYLAAFEAEQLASLGMLFFEAYDFVIILWGLFFGFHLVLLGYLVYRSGFWPGWLGILLVLGGIGYLAQSYGHIVAPQFDAVLETLVLVLATPGELAFTIWLLWKGIDVERWKVAAGWVA